MTRTATATCLPIGSGSLSVEEVSVTGVELAWSRSNSAFFKEYIVFRIGGPVSVSTHHRPWVLVVCLVLLAYFSRGRSKLSRASLLLAIVLLPIGKASADPEAQGTSPRACSQPNCKSIAQISNRELTQHTDTDVLAGSSYDYFLRIVNRCEEYSDTAPMPVEIPLPTPTPGPSSSPTRTSAPSFTPTAPPASTFTPTTAPPTATPTVDVDTFEGIVIGPSHFDNNPRKITDLFKDDQVTITEVSGLLTFNNNPICNPKQATYQVDANGLALSVYNDGELGPLCYGSDQLCNDPMQNQAHAGLYMKVSNNNRVFIGRDGHSFTAAASGPLHLAINDCPNEAAPNVGNFTVKVTVTRARR